MNEERVKRVIINLIVGMRENNPCLTMFDSTCDGDCEKHTKKVKDMSLVEILEKIEDKYVAYSETEILLILRDKVVELMTKYGHCPRKVMPESMANRFIKKNGQMKYSCGGYQLCDYHIIAVCDMLNKEDLEELMEFY